VGFVVLGIVFVPTRYMALGCTSAEGNDIAIINLEKHFIVT
jgi:hypothetical protein